MLRTKHSKTDRQTDRPSDKQTDRHTYERTTGENDNDKVSKNYNENIGIKTMSHTGK